MKKKQLAKLKQQFRPSFNQARAQLFREMEKQAMTHYQLPVEVGIHFETPEEMSITFLGETTRDQVIAVPLDENFNLVIKRIQQSEAGLLARFSRKLVDEFASYWGATTQGTKKEEIKEAAPVTLEAATTQTPTEKTLVENETEGAVEKEATTKSAFDEFKTAITAFPKFAVVEETDSLHVVEKTAKEDRLLATISTKEKNQFTIEPALERKYKLKLEVIPVIEAFSATVESTK
ncbi:hypothetical protein ACYSNO_11075 [Enterococcus sp. LJL98]